MLLKDAQDRSDEHGGAVAWARLGSVCVRTGDITRAKQCFASARDLFQKVGDQRGEGWAMVNAAECSLIDDDPTRALALLTEANAINDQIDGSSIDLIETIERMKKLVKRGKLRDAIDNERQRLLAQSTISLPTRLAR